MLACDVLKILFVGIYKYADIYKYGERIFEVQRFSLHIYKYTDDTYTLLYRLLMSALDLTNLTLLSVVTGQ